MAKKVSNQFVVNTVEDGQSAPYYFQEWFAWSNDATTASVITPPNIDGSWATSIPQQGSYTYLWRKSIRYVWNATTKSYDSETAQYIRMSGTNGTSIKTRGSVDDASDRGNGTATLTNETTITLSDGDAVTQLDNGHLYQWITEGGGSWLDLGQFKGDNGKTYYTHVAWAINVNASTTPITVTGFVTTKSPNDTEHVWMGVYIDEESGQDSSNAALYTWSNNKGDKGNDGEDAAVATCTPDKISIQCNADGSVASSNGYNVTFAMKVGTNDATITGVSYNSAPSGVSVSSLPVAYAKTIAVYTSATATGMAQGITFTVTGTYNGKTYSAKVSVALIGVTKGSAGERGKVGRFYYYGGVFNQLGTTPFTVNDAQAPYFEHTESNQKRYHVYNPATNPSGNQITEAQMWAVSNQSWNNAPWEAMTNDFKYVISEVVFAAFAKLGSFIISGDWMLTHYGVIYDTNGDEHTIDGNNSWTYDGTTYTPDNAYLLFDADYPNSSKPLAPNFAPSYCVDGLTGITYQNKAHIKGEIYATSGEFTGKITATSGSLESVSIGPKYGKHFLLKTESSKGLIVGLDSHTELIYIGFDDNGSKMVIGEQRPSFGSAYPYTWTTIKDDRMIIRAEYSGGGSGSISNNVFNGEARTTYVSNGVCSMEIGTKDGVAQLCAYGSNGAAWPDVETGGAALMRSLPIGSVFMIGSNTFHGCGARELWVKISNPS